MSDVPRKRRIYYPKPIDTLEEVTPTPLPIVSQPYPSQPLLPFPILNAIFTTILQILWARLEFWRSRARYAPVARGSVVLVKETADGRGWCIIEKPLGLYSESVEEV